MIPASMLPPQDQYIDTPQQHPVATAVMPPPQDQYIAAPQQFPHVATALPQPEGIQQFPPQYSTATVQEKI